MKFLCDQCKAKYQIADDKVAGRTVRMKCRKCGHSIEVRAAVTETSVAAKASEIAGEDGARLQAPKPPPPRPSPIAGGLSSHATRAGAPPRPPPRSTADGSLATAFQKNVDRDEDATAASLDLRELSAADEWYVAVNGVPVGPVRVGEIRRKAAMGAVTADSLCWHEGMEEWRAIRAVTELAAVVREAATATRPSQLPPEPRPSPTHAGQGQGQGQGGSRPSAARTTGQHAAVTREGGPRELQRTPHAPAVAPWGAKGSSGTAPIASQKHSSAPAPSVSSAELEEEAAPTFVGVSPMLDLEPEPDSEAPGVNGAGAAGAWGVAPAADPFAASSARAHAAHANGHGVSADPFAASKGAASPFGSTAEAAALAPSALALSQTPPPAASVAHAPIAPGSAAARRTSPIAIGVVVMFGCFGVVSAYFLFSRPPIPVAASATGANGPTAPRARTAPTPTDLPPVGDNATGATGASSSAPASPEVVSAPKVASGGGRPAGGAAGSTGSASPKPAGAVTDPALRDLIASTGNGPSASPGPNAGGGGAQLTEDEIKSVVSAHGLGVRRSCWDRTSSTTPSVNVMVHMVIAGSGQVTQANATGNDPVVAHCLEDEVRRWHWPGGGEVNVPFHFLRQ